MVELDEQLRSYASWLAEQADEQGRMRTAQLDPHSPAHRNRRRWWPIAAVAAVSALVLGLLAVVGTRDAQAPADQPPLPTGTTAPTPTDAPITTAATPITTAATPITASSSAPTTISPESTPTTAFNGAPTATPSGVDADVPRPLIDLAEGDVIVPTYVPLGMTFQGSAQIFEHGDRTTEFFFTLQTTDGTASISVSLHDWNTAIPALRSNTLNDPNHPPLEIAGVTWGWSDFDSGRIANIDRFSVWVNLAGLDELEDERFIGGLRAASIEQFPGPIVYDTADGLSVFDGDDLREAEIVASDDQFELAAAQAGDQLCIELTQKTVSATESFDGVQCWESARLAEFGIVRTYPLFLLDDADTRRLIVGVVDSPDITAARITSPSGESVVVPTGPVNQNIDGRFFLARLELDASDGIDFDQITIEDASP